MEAFENNSFRYLLIVFISHFYIRVGRKKTTVGMIFGTAIFCVGVAVIPKSTDVKVLQSKRSSVECEQCLK